MSKEVQQMFASIATRYDLANDVLSLGVHRFWRKQLINFAGISPGQHILDLCTGTGDLAFALNKAVGRSGKVIGLDFVNEMLAGAINKQTRIRANQSNFTDNTIEFCQADALCLPFSNQMFDAVTIAFGIRNVDSLEFGLEEIKRVLKPGGKAIILEFGQPKIPLFSSCYRFYSDKIMPWIGDVLTGNRAAYEYLPRTSRNFPAGKAFTKILLNSGFGNVRLKMLIGGVAYIYVAERL